MLLQTVRRYNVKLNYEKLQYKCTEVNFYGKTYTTDGCTSAWSKITAIVEMPSPSSQERSTVICWYDKLFIKILTKIDRTS